MGISWSDLRALEGSQQKGFEQLCTQLAAREDIPNRVRFEAHGNPDGGVECRWVLDNGDEVGWQAKFFRSALERGQWSQVDDSVRTMLERWPKLVRYVVCFPRDLTNEGESEREREADKWDAHKQKWQNWAAKKGRKIEFDRWGETELLERLAREEHAGRARYWFERDLFSDAWFDKRLEEAKADLDHRYLPYARGEELHVDLDIQDLVEAVGRRPRLRTIALGAALTVRDRARTLSVTEKELSVASRVALRDSCLQAARRVADLQLVGVKELTGIPEAREATRQAISDAERALQETQQLDERESPARSIRNLTMHLHWLSQALHDLRAFLHGPLIRATERSVLVVRGRAGTGKSHLLAHMASRRASDGKRSLVLLAQQLDASRAPIDAIARRLGFSGNADELLGALDAAAEVTGGRLLLFLDALNEASGRDYWNCQLSGTLAAVSRWPNLGIVVTVRDGFEELVLPDRVRDNEVLVEHPGLAGHELEASEKFFQAFGITAPSVPLLRPEFTNPLLLYLVCRTLEANGQRSFAPGELGLQQIIDPMVLAAEQRLSRSLDFDARERPVFRALEALAGSMKDRGWGFLPRERASELVEPIRYGAEWRAIPHSRRLLQGLLNEGLLAEEVDRTTSPASIVVRFQFQLLENWFVANVLLSSTTEATVQAAFAPEGAVCKYLSHAGLSWHRDLLEVLSVLLPERFGCELFDHLDGTEAYEAVLRALPSRAARTVGGKVVDFVRRAASTEYQPLDSLFQLAMDACLACAAIPDHALNATFLHELLEKLPMAKRDLSWSTYLFDRARWGEAGHPIFRLRAFGMNARRGDVADEVALLLGITLAWFLTTSHRPLRDTSTKALVALASAAPELCEPLLQRFSSVDDPYIIERLFGAVYGCVARTPEPRDVRAVAAAALDVADSVLPRVRHFLLRDYVEGIRKLSIQRGGSGEPPNASPVEGGWPADLPSLDDLHMAFEPQRDGERIHSSVWSGLDRWSDFSRYQMGSDHWAFPWSTRALRGPAPPSRSKQRQDFEAGLNAEQRAMYDDWLAWAAPNDLEPADDDGPQGAELSLLSEFVADHPERAAAISGDASDDERAEAVTGYRWSAQQRGQRQQSSRDLLAGRLTLAQRDAFTSVVEPFVLGRRRDEYPFKLHLARRWMLDRILSLGWDEQTLGEVDRRPADNHYRSGHKPERLGKKYQWIAWHSLLAEASDCLEFVGGLCDHDPISTPSAVAWKRWIRDIDPTCLLSRTAGGRHSDDGACWWSPVEYGCAPLIPDMDWLGSTEHLPPLSGLFQVESADGQNWFVLSTFRSFRESWESDPFEESTLPRRLDVTVQSYLVRREDADRLFSWARQQNFWGRWMPYSDSSSSRLRLHEYWWHDAYRDLSPGKYAERKGESVGSPVDFSVPDEGYSADDSSHDCSVAESFSIRLPGRVLADLLGLRIGCRDGTVVDASGRTAFRDPSGEEPGPSALLMSEEAYAAVQEAGFDFVWTVMGELFVRGMPTEAKRRAVSGAWRWTGGGWEGDCHLTDWVDGDPRKIGGTSGPGDV